MLSSHSYLFLNFHEQEGLLELWKKLKEHYSGSKWSHKILPFSQTYIDKVFSEIDVMSAE